MAKYVKKTDKVYQSKSTTVDEDQLEKLATIGCTNEEMASWFGVSKDTLERQFAATIAKGRGKTRCSLRRLQWLSASSGNVQMQIWLGKQMLGQKDSVFDMDEEDGGTTITFSIAKKSA